MSILTDRWGLETPELTGDSPDVPYWMRQLALQLDDVAMDDQGPIGSRPASSAGAPGKSGRWYKGDDGSLARDRGDGWDRVVLDGDARLTDGRTPSDGSVTLAKLAPDVAPHLRKIGEVFDWWRAGPTEPVPDGCVIPVGQTLAAADHAFSSRAGLTVTLPDLRGKFTMGANSANADGSAGAAGNALANAPGIGGAGGSNATRDLTHAHLLVAAGAHQHSLPNHTHNIDAEAGLSGSENAFHQHGLTLSKNLAVAVGGGSTYSGYLVEALDTGYENGPHQHSLNNHAHGGFTSGYDGSHTGGDPATSSLIGDHTHTVQNAAVSTDVRPQFVGMLKLMRVK